VVQQADSIVAAPATRTQRQVAVMSLRMVSNIAVTELARDALTLVKRGLRESAGLVQPSAHKMSPNRVKNLA
jgi:hypothetical protein